VAIHRGIVKVGPELSDGVLAIRTHEDLPAKTDDGLIGAAVPVVFEPLPVQRHHPFGVRRGPEDVVGKETVAVVGAQLRDLRGANRPMPDERWHPAQRARHQGETLQRGAVFTAPPDDFFPPELVQQGVVLDGKRDRRPDVLAKPNLRDRPAGGTCCRQLQTTTATVAAVANDNGWPSEFSLNTAFKRRYGVSPGR
jgi:AraC-like DNA-binding protein